MCNANFAYFKKNFKIDTLLIFKPEAPILKHFCNVTLSVTSFKTFKKLLVNSRLASERKQISVECGKSPRFCCHSNANKRPLGSFVVTASIVTSQMRVGQVRGSRVASELLLLWRHNVWKMWNRRMILSKFKKLS